MSDVQEELVALTPLQRFAYFAVTNAKFREHLRKKEWDAAFTLAGFMKPPTPEQKTALDGFTDKDWELISKLTKSFEKGIVNN